VTAPAARLGLKPGEGAVAVGLPEALAALLALPPPGDAPRLLIGACARIADVAPVAAALLPRYRTGALLWFAYPKLSGPLRSDISRDRGWEPLAEAGFLGVAQVALDAAWSALRFRPRDEIRVLTRRG
jgi:hypothetical protein